MDKAILVGVELPDNEYPVEYTLKELANLAKANKEAENIAISRVVKKMQKEGICDIYSHKITFEQDNDYYYFSINAVCLEKIGVSHNIDIGNY